MKIIFLDIDGVVTSIRTGWYNFDIYTVHFLRWICKKADVKIVISSTWRMNHNNRKFWETIFSEYIHEDFRTPFANETGLKNQTVCRGHEIEYWLNKHPEVDKYLILDDDTDMLSNQMKSFIQTDTYNGVLYHHRMLIRDYFEITDYPNEDKEIYRHKNMFAATRIKK